MKKAGTGWIITGWIFSIFGGIIGLAIANHIVNGKTRTADGKLVFTYDEKSRKKGRPMLLVAIAVFIIAVILRIVFIR